MHTHFLFSFVIIVFGSNLLHLGQTKLRYFFKKQLKLRLQCCLCDYICKILLWKRISNAQKFSNMSGQLLVPSYR